MAQALCSTIVRGSSMATAGMKVKFDPDATWSERLDSLRVILEARDDTTIQIIGEVPEAVKVTTGDAESRSRNRTGTGLIPQRSQGSRLPRSSLSR